ncbi:ABC transporter permease [Parahaliea mediterranea]|uniref:ABC transporter permease n=1 Tax=Parahaliea mediterranea TaxID=651086 RepID=A0A939DHP7_9GAMM|nr:ABC transporter permease [Parahaliea mediterranea]MBN7798454.1 ABC transporter permease [Parahaliea mediterranea]
MSPPQAPAYQLSDGPGQSATLSLSGDWAQGQEPVDFRDLRPELVALAPRQLLVDGDALGRWDSLLMAFLLQCHNYCRAEGIELDVSPLPESARQLLRVATTVPPHERPREPRPGLLQRLNPLRAARGALRDIAESMAFLGDLGIALLNLCRGRSNTRFTDFRHFCYQSGPDAFAIISLTSVLVGMILAYLGAVQLKLFGAEIYVANLVVIGMLREMGVLMTAVVMAGRTGAAYAAQLGTMQTNEEIDAITTMGVSPMEFLVVPRVLALVITLPLLTIYADLLGVLGGAIVAGGMGITLLQYVSQIEQAISMTHLLVGLSKSVVFAVLIAIAGCRSGIQSGRGSAAVGNAATEAVVTALIYLIVADAAINILFQHLEI